MMRARHHVFSISRRFRVRRETCAPLGFGIGPHPARARLGGEGVNVRRAFPATFLRRRP